MDRAKRACWMWQDAVGGSKDVVEHAESIFTDALAAYLSLELQWLLMMHRGYHMPVKPLLI